MKLNTKIKVLNANNVANNQKNDNNTNNNSNMSMAFKSKANSSLYTSSKDDNIDYNNKYKFDEFYTLFKENQNQNYENALNKNRTMSNINYSILLTHIIFFIHLPIYYLEIIVIISGWFNIGHCSIFI